MFVYSKKIIRFVRDIKKITKEVLSQEIGLRVAGDRFYDKREAFSYPIKIVVYNNKAMLGYFAADFFELGFHELLMNSSREQLVNIVRHELGHYLTFIQYGNTIQAHGTEFRAFCQRHGWSDEVYKATTCLDDGASPPATEECGVLRKVQKLMALASSSNHNEAEQAMIKSQQLLLKHNIDAKFVDSNEEEKVFLKRIMKQKKENAKMRSIARILETFFVNTIYNRCSGYIYLEIIGTATNVEIAEYVADFLDRELENLWDHAKKNHVSLKGMVAKNSFILGIAKGYCDKIHSLKREYQSEVANALMVIEKKLVDAKTMIYPRLQSSRSHGSFCQHSLDLGEQVGRKLNINTAISNTAKNLGNYINWLQ